MGLAWHPMALPGIVVLVVGFTLAAFVYWARPQHAQNRMLAFVLYQGSVSTAFVTGVPYLATDRATAMGFAAVFFVSASFIPGVYLLFLSTLNTPLGRPFRTRTGRSLLVGLTAVLLGTFFYREQWFVGDIVRRPSGPGSEWVFTGGPGLQVAAVIAILTYVYGLVVAISAYRRASAPLARAQAKAYAIAFGIRDALVALNIALVVLIIPYGPVPVLLNDLGFPAIDVLFFTLLSYGILHAQLFGIDLRLKATIRQSPVPVGLTVAFFVAKESVEALLNANGIFYGLAAALLVALAFRPLQSLGRRLADRLMPHVQDTEEYRTRRKHDIYEAALEMAQADGDLSDEDVRFLERLRTKLGITSAA